MEVGRDKSETILQSIVMTQGRCCWTPSWSESHSSRYGLSEGQVQWCMSKSGYGVGDSLWLLSRTVTSRPVIEHAYGIIKESQLRPTYRNRSQEKIAQYQSKLQRASSLNTNIPRISHYR